MNPFDGLLPPPLAPQPLPRRGGPAAAAATARRRSQARGIKAAGVAGTLSLAFGGIVLLRPPAPLHSVETNPAATPPASAPATAPATPTRTGAGLAPDRSQTSAGAPRQAGASGAAPTATHAPGPIATRPPAPGGGGDVETPAGYTRIDRTFVPDPDPGNDCLVETSFTTPGAVLCTRVIAPASVESGAPARFLLQSCAVGAEQRIHFTGGPEADFYIFFEEDGSQAWRSASPPGAAHDLVIPGGQCAQYTIHWDGRGASGKPLAPDSYIAGGRLEGNGGYGQISQDPFVVT